jgi:hypothetical protein
MACAVTGKEKSANEADKKNGPFIMHAGKNKIKEDF